ncbi:hypothetical protein B4919_09300 [Francisella tularensis subsp. novicida]|uniref:hypothetical protein n=1 Tax=Francisella tularensis TaxID=263 RepID=UPI000CE2A27B|nr:hypothetical protein [Francisella tularensis]AVC44963.1 hypothetical protein B4919_09300 [Francisella tularensis subsp. novicida]
MDNILDFCWDDLPSICREDQDIEVLLDDIYELNNYSNKNHDDRYGGLFQLKDENGNLVIDTIADIRNFKTDIYKRLSQLHIDATKQNIAKVFNDILRTDNNGLGEVLIYLSGLWRLIVTDSENENIRWSDFSSRIKLSESDDYFIQLSKTNSHTSFTIHTDKHCYIEPIVFDNIIDSISFVSKSSDYPVHFSKIKFRGIELVPYDINKNSIDWWGDEKQSFNLENLILKVDGKGNITSHGNDFENFQMKITNTDKSVKLNNHSCSLLLSDSISKLNISDCNFTKLDFQNCEFTNIPNFDDKSSIKHSVNIDKKSFDNLLKVENAGSLEFSRLAEFFNRNNAYIEAQKLHRHYLLAKAEETLKKDSEEDKKTKNKPCFCKKWTGLSGLINLYDLINGCGTSLLKPFIAMFFVWIANVVILQYQFINGGMDVFYNSINNILPLAGLFTHSEGICMLGVILALKLTSILATLLWFLIALQIRKLLRLKE